MAYDYYQCREMDYDESDMQGCRRFFFLMLSLAAAIVGGLIWLLS